MDKKDPKPLTPMYSLSDYTYDLPSHLIAEEAVHPHHDARLIVIDKKSGTIEAETTFWHLDSYLPQDRVLFFNNSRVLPARIRLTEKISLSSLGKKNTIKDGEILFCQKIGENRFEALVRPGKRFDLGAKIILGENTSLEVIEKTDTGRILEAHGASIESIMRTFGELPLPPYITYSREKEADYQTVFAEKDGSVAAPTASLHFTKPLLDKLIHEKHYTTLHVGLGTFSPIKTGDIREYQIHRELAEVDISLFHVISERKQAGKKIVAVGTTVCRTLESLPYVWQSLDEGKKKEFDTSTRSYWDNLTETIGKEDFISRLSWDQTTQSLHFFTSIYIYPGKSLHVVDELITNFHLPESSLLVLVSSILGREKTLQLYEEAIRKEYRFFSFGDGMYIKTKETKKLETCKNEKFEDRS